jgi:glutamine amidotransferase
MITIVDCGLGNIASVVNMVRKCGGTAKVSNKRDEILSASKIILPGVGAFDHGITQLKAFDMFLAIQEKAILETPILGICLGMQLLAKRSEEGLLNGLGLIDAEFKRFAFETKSSLRIPHVGWNHVRVIKDNPLIPNDGSEQRFYFTHSYHAVCKQEAEVLAETEYGYSFTSVYCRKNIFGVQFHPEKSHRFGMALIKRFVLL